MEAAVRWSPHSSPDQQRFLVVDVADPGFTLHQVDTLDNRSVSYHTVSKSGRLPNFGAFDWSKTNESIIALGLVSGSANLVRLREDGEPCETVAHYRIKQQRKCNSIAFSTQDWLAVGVDRARGDVSLFVYDAKREQSSSRTGEAASSGVVRRLCAAELVSSVRFFPSSPQELVASTQRAFMRVYDLRDGSSPTTGNLQASTKNVNNIAVDPLDEHYFASAGSTDDPSVTVWDRRWMSSSTSSGSTSGAVFDFRPAVNNSVKTTVWSLRYSGQRRGRLAVCSSTGELTVIDMNESKVRSADVSAPANPYGGAGPWTSNRYVSETRSLERPYHDPRHGRDSKKRIIAFDWIDDAANTSLEGQDVLALRPSREVDVLRVPSAKALASITARNDLSIGLGDLSLTGPNADSGPLPPEVPSKHHRNTNANAEDFGPYGYPNDPEEDTIDEDQGAPSRSSSKISRLLASSPSTIQASRCRAGYVFDCAKNLRLVSGHFYLERLWEIVNRFQLLSQNDEMLHSTYDLSYVGVSGLWSESIGPSPHRRLSSSNSPGTVADAIIGLNAAKDLPAFEGERTSFPEHRQLCLLLCGWKFTLDSLETECQELIDRGLYYQAIVQAVLHGETHIALNLLRSLIRSKTIPNIGLGALLASEDVSNNKEQREMCLWMAADTDDPALKALLAYLVTGNWRDVMKTNYLHLGYRMALGLKYLNDTELSGFIQTETARAIKKGDLEGILLTGLTESGMDLLQSYITRTNDLQTATLAMAFSTPLYVDDVRWEMWKETYFMQMQAWRCFVERTKFTVQHNRMARTKDGKTLIEAPKAQVTLRCLHCQGSLARGDSKYLSGHPPHTTDGGPPTPGAVRIASPPAIAGTVCPNCGRHLPRCGICQMWLGTPNPATSGGAKELDKLDDVMAKLMCFCKLCGHGFHADHARGWFKRHQICPVPDCRCACGVLG